MTLQLLAVVATVSLVSAVWWAIPALSPATIPFGVRVPPDRAEDASIVTARAVYTHRIVTWGLLAAAAGIPVVLFDVSTVMMPILAGALVIADTTAHLLANRSVGAAKRDGAWYTGTRQGVTADFSFRTDPVRVPWPHLAPAIAVLIVTATVGITVYPQLPSTLPSLDGLQLSPSGRTATTFGTAFMPVLTQVGLCLLLPLVAVALTRARPDLDAARPAASARRYRRYLRAITTLLFVTTALINLTLLVIALRQWELVPASALTSIILVVPLVANIAAVAVFQLRVGHAGHRLPAAPGDETQDTGLVQRDDDRHWHLGGFVYLNRDDPAILVHQRIGVGWTVNLGHPVGWVSATVVLAAAIALVVLSGFGFIDLPEK